MIKYGRRFNSCFHFGVRIYLPVFPKYYVNLFYFCSSDVIRFLLFLAYYHYPCFCCIYCHLIYFEYLIPFCYSILLFHFVCCEDSFHYVRKYRTVYCTNEFEFQHLQYYKRRKKRIEDTLENS